MPAKQTTKDFKNLLEKLKLEAATREIKKLKVSKLTYNLGAQIFTFSLTFICLITAAYLYYNVPPSSATFNAMMILIFLGLFGVFSMLQFLIENVWFKRILSVWSTNVVLMRAMVLTLFVCVAYFLNLAGFFSFFALMFLALLFMIYLKWLSSIGK